MDHQEKRGTALITGASSGIGATYAALLARRGHDLLLVARDAGRLRALADRLRAEAGVMVDVLVADLTEAEGLAAVEHRVQSDSAIRMLVNNAGLGPTGPALASDLRQLDRMLALNVAALHRLALAAAQAFIGRGGGTLVNIASVVALNPGVFPPTYVASKAFVLALTESLAGETAGRGLRLQAVMPGLTRTEIFERAGHDANRLDPEMVMEAEEMVSAALVGLDQGELVTIPSLPDAGLWAALVAARQAMAPDLSRRHPAARYRLPA
ncbi:SDR family oxidoreductase [Roseomonas stagni]|uniref:SDR family oxidoreductase n=2 Tax=Falsiroseomonas algicola TaxID=2716930 RepID=A0A6M1LUQ8_9PROT|nr:SDR family oxidoreductase [Falsiroseomonas algicola]